MPAIAGKVALFLLRSPKGRKALLAAIAAVFAAVVAAIALIAVVLTAAVSALADPCLTGEGPSGTTGGLPAGSAPPSQNAVADIPADYLKAYRAAGQEYGIDWAVVAAIGKHESDHGRSTLPGVHSGSNPAGAMGPMQFIGSTWASFGVDGDGDGERDVYDYRDAIPAAARYLRASGAPQNYEAAIYAYNHSDAYVQWVLNQAAAYRSAAKSGPSGGERAAAVVAHARTGLSLLASPLAIRSAYAAPQGWDVVDSSKQINWVDHTRYDSANNHAVAAWNALGSVGIQEGGGGIDLTVGDAVLAPGTGGRTGSGGTLYYNPNVMNISTPNAQEGITAHEWGHALGLGHTPKGSNSVMNGVLTNGNNNPTSPTEMDKKVYYQLWGHSPGGGSGRGTSPRTGAPEEAPSGSKDAIPIACEPGTPGQEPGGGAIPPPSEEQKATGDAGAVLAEAKRYMGTPYVLGGDDMDGIDCSGLTMRAYEAVGIQLPHWDDKQMNYGTPVDDPAPGDLVFFHEHAGEGPTTHVALYYGNGRILHASSYHGEVVISDMKYLNGYVGARRLL